MKVCLLLSGGMRIASDAYPYFKSNLLDRYDVDTFISTWHSPNVYELTKLFNPVVVDIENYENGFESKWKSIVEDDLYKLETNADLISICSMWYKTMRVNQLRTNYSRWVGQRYDVVLRTRPDILIEQPIELIHPESNTIYIPRGYDWSGGIGDLMAYGNETIMNEYCNLFYQFSNTIQQMDKINAETVLKRYLEWCQFTIERPEIDLTLRGFNIKETYWFSK